MNSKYFETWEQYKAENPEITENQEKAMVSKIQTDEEMMFRFIMFLCV